MTSTRIIFLFAAVLFVFLAVVVANGVYQAQTAPHRNGANEIFQCATPTQNSNQVQMVCGPNPAAATAR